MRTNEERIAAMHKKAGEMKRVRQLRRGLAVRGGALAVCLAAVIALALVLPGLAEGMTVNGHTAVMAASIISNNAAVGYIVVGIASFLLGIAFTVFCVSLQKWKRDGGGRS